MGRGEVRRLRGRVAREVTSDAESGIRDKLDTAEQAGFDLLLTCDQNVRYQQNFTGHELALGVLSSKSLADTARNGSSDRYRR